MEMRCYRRLLGISYKDHTTNEEVSRRIENAIGPHIDLLTIVRQRKLKWYGHTTRSSGLVKTIMQGLTYQELQDFLLVKCLFALLRSELVSDKIDQFLVYFSSFLNN
ncbi:eukaryotic translation initiation factor 3 subunit f [Plakobranchus ocellatus]|uniref:Eukaryotic translation initiation factor 3 subunit f n=1 Tax=Plakobranchus ocellatus TaxID=259542 RepID=A0AAV3YRQ4_9GAST|nr:eukaryotic translation initiation factor 3 subunit f [Plakobranchus ocellatus]